MNTGGLITTRTAALLVVGILAAGVVVSIALSSQISSLSNQVSSLGTQITNLQNSVNALQSALSLKNVATVSTSSGTCSYTLGNTEFSGHVPKNCDIYVGPIGQVTITVWFVDTQGKSAGSPTGTQLLVYVGPSYFTPSNIAVFNTAGNGFIPFAAAPGNGYSATFSGGYVGLSITCGKFPTDACPDFGVAYAVTAITPHQ